MEFIGELILEVFGEIFCNAIGERAGSSYVPKWLRVLIVTLLAGLLLLAVVIICGDEPVVLGVLGGIILFFWVLMIVRVVRIKTKRYEIGIIDETRQYVGKRSFFGDVRGELDLPGLGRWVNNAGKVVVSFEKDESLPKKERMVNIGEKGLA